MLEPAFVDKSHHLSDLLQDLKGIASNQEEFRFLCDIITGADAGEVYLSEATKKRLRDYLKDVVNYPLALTLPVVL